MHVIFLNYVTDIDFDGDYTEGVGGYGLAVTCWSLNIFETKLS